MRFINDTLLRLFVWAKDESAQTMAEYGLILALISIAAVVVMGLLGTKIGTVFSTVTNKLGNLT